MHHIKSDRRTQASEQEIVRGLQNHEFLRALVDKR